jgi:MFS family permease
MGETTDRIPCPKCQASNFASSAVCWQCGQPLRAQANQPPPSNQPPSPGEYQPPPSYSPPPAPSGENTQILIILGFICAAIGFLCCPILFSTAAIIMGVVAKNRGNPLGTWVIVAGAASLVIGIIIGATVGALNWRESFPQ